MDSYWTTDIKITQSFMDHWLFSLTINNIFDKGYETFASRFSDAAFNTSIAGYPGAERWVFASFTYQF
jgi:outer membrane receptor protein involved in Fe transport